MRKMHFLFLLLLSPCLWAQVPEKLNSSEIYKEFEKLNFLGSVLYVAAHPDDENTRLISYLSNHLNARTAYLSLTRGDGGQNLIGPELREVLGVIRTQELLAARRIDGGEQFFTRANDFGYSKHPEETLEIWNEEEVLSDVVRTIRKFKPDIIINRFKVNSAGDTHGHHTASAILSKKAFELAGEPSAYPEQAEELGLWQPKKLFFNTSPWFYESQEAFLAADKSHFLHFDVGTYYPLLGLSNSEIASLSRSQHQSQGFGSTGSRGKETEYIELIGGIHPQNNNDLFHGINTSWSRVEGGQRIGALLEAAQEQYDFSNPAASIPQLVEAYRLIQNLEDDHWRTLKTAQIKDLIAASAGLYLEAVATEPLVTPGKQIVLQLEAINRSSANMQLRHVKVQPEMQSLSIETVLPENVVWQEELAIQLPDTMAYTTPYWLQEKGSLGMYRVPADSLIGLPETPPKIKVHFVLGVEGVEIPFEREIVYKRNDPVQGETYRPFEVVPEISVRSETDVLVFEDQTPRHLEVRIQAVQDSVEGRLHLKAPGPWRISPASYSFGPLPKGSTQLVQFQITPPPGQNEAILQPIVQSNGATYQKEILQLEYPHIPTQTLLMPSGVKLVKLDIQKEGERIGYIQGAGDVVPQALQQIGYRVEILRPGTITTGKLKQFDAVITGIRAYNTVEALAYQQKILMEYVKQGGTLIVQYNTSRGLILEELGPYPLQLSRDRVTNEQATVRFLQPNHPVLTTPNQLSEADFEGWVQERGLYFPDAWAAEYEAVLSMNDPGESPKNGSLLVASYGEGYFVYTGLSFFRQFPAGVPGAYRLFANMISLGQAAQTGSSSTSKAAR